MYVPIGTDFGPLMSNNLYVIFGSVTTQFLRGLLYAQLLNVQAYVEVHYGTSSLVSVLAVSLYLAVSSPFLPHSLSPLCHLYTVKGCVFFTITQNCATVTVNSATEYLLCV